MLGILVGTAVVYSVSCDHNCRRIGLLRKGLVILGSELYGIASSLRFN